LVSDAILTTGKKNKTHGLADAAGLTSAVIAHKDLAAKKKTEASYKDRRRQKQQLLTVIKAEARAERRQDLGLPSSTQTPD
jgi:hypothetical protein